MQERYPLFKKSINRFGQQQENHYSVREVTGSKETKGFLVFFQS
jgi:hypothetical protein